MKSRPELLIVLLALLVSGLLMSQALKKDKTKQAPQVTEQTSPTPSLDEKALLRGQLAEMREYDQRLLATVYWSLSGVFLLVVVIAGLNWFANYRVYERERESLIQEVERHAKALHGEIDQRFHKLSNSLVAAGQKQTDDLSRQLSSDAKKIVTVESQKQREEINALRREISEGVGSLRRDFTRAQVDETEFRARYYESKEANYDAFGLWLENLEHMKNVSWLWDEHHIGDVFRRLEAILGKGQPISYNFQAKLLDLLTSSPPTMSDDVDRIKNLLKSTKKIS